MIVTGAVVAALAFATTTAAAKVLLADGPMTPTGLECPTTGSASPAACPTAVPEANPGSRINARASRRSATARRAPGPATA